MLLSKLITKPKKSYFNFPKGVKIAQANY